MKTFTTYAFALREFCHQLSRNDGLPLCLVWSVQEKLYYVCTPGDHARWCYTSAHDAQTMLLHLDEDQAALWFQAFAHENAIDLLPNWRDALGMEIAESNLRRPDVGPSEAVQQ